MTGQNNKRLPFNANTFDDVWQYWQTRSRQLAYAGFDWTKEVNSEPFGYTTAFVKDDQRYVSGYVLLDKRSKGFFLPWLKKQEYPIVTSHSCNLEGYFKKVGFTNYLIPPLPEVWKEYQLIENFYSDKQANRSQLFLMNHIDEALLVMKKIGATLESQKAFCLHPLFQADSDLKDNYLLDLSTINPQALLLSMEYRSVANEYLSLRNIKNLDEIRLSPLKEVNDMLIGDKVQNYKDFLLYHKASHQRSADLDQYFNNWLTKLNSHDLVSWLMEQKFETHEPKSHKMKR